MRPWFWILIAALAILGIVALVLAISAGNETVDQKKIADEATAQVKEEVSGLNEAVETVNEFQEESAELAEKDAKRINQQVAKATAGGEEELRKLKRRVAALEEETGSLGEETKALAERSQGEHREREGSPRRTHRRSGRSEPRIGRTRTASRGSSKNRLVYVGHATVLIELDGVRLLTDPVLGEWIGPLHRHGAAPARGGRPRASTRS